MTAFLLFSPLSQGKPEGTYKDSVQYHKKNASTHVNDIWTQPDTQMTANIMQDEHRNKVVSEKVLYPELSYLVTGILFDTQNALGRYAREKQYGDLIETKLKESKISHKRELSIGDSGNILDFIVDDKIVLELKASRVITGDNYRQIQNYLQQTQLKLGLLVNFRNKYLKPIRVIRIDS